MPTFCYRCGAKLDGNAQFCSKCVAPFVSPEQSDMNAPAYHVLRLADALNARDRRSKLRLEKRSERLTARQRLGATVRNLFERLWFWLWRSPAR
jgi:hypothetical protein